MSGNHTPNAITIAALEACERGETEIAPVCACGCGKAILAPTHLRQVKKFYSDQCRQRWHSARRKLALEHFARQDASDVAYRVEHGTLPQMVKADKRDKGDF